jgi:peptidyl-prolyl cis-trans isomerase B (cyclophilin B)
MKNPIIKIYVRDLGVMTAELYPEKAPKTVENFLNLVKTNFYNGLIFHRVIAGFMIQGGGYTEDFEDKETPSIRGEFRANGFAQNDLKHTRGVLSMARTSAPNSASSQFFVMHQNAPHLDGQYAGFGILTDGFDVLDRIASTKTGRYGYFADVPREPIVIDRMELVEE